MVRTSNPPERLASASGIINQAGFVATLIVVFAIGFVLDALTPGSSSDYSGPTFKAAMAVQYAVWALGAAQIWRYRRLVRQLLPRTTVESGSTMVDF